MLTLHKSNCQTCPTDAPTTARKLGADAARAVGRFNPTGPVGYRAAHAGTAIRATRAEAVTDEREHWERVDAAEARRRGVTA